MSDAGLRALSGVGFVTMLGIAWLSSSQRDLIRWKTVVWGIGLQFGLAVILLKTAVGRVFFVAVNSLVGSFLSYVDSGTRFLFGPLVDIGPSFALGALPIIIFMGSFFAILYHLGIVQAVVTVAARVLSRTMGLSGAEALAGVANIFVGMVESALVVAPYLGRMTRSELFTLMALGMSTVAGSVLMAYVQMLGGGDFAGHLVTASLLSAPAGLLVAKMMIPETEVPETAAGGQASFPRETTNIIDAAAEGAISGLRLAAYVGALLLAFYALITMMNDFVSFAGGLVGHPEITFQGLLGILMAPVAFIMGVPWQDAQAVGSLLGIKTVLNEFIAYQQLGQAIEAGSLQPRSVLIASYALCGFANFGSLAILLGGLGGIAPERRHEVAQLGLRAILAGSLATFMTACVAGMIL
jgi:CNT family concentrative nucleoside transporter